MKFSPPGSTKSSTPAPEGSHPARIVRLLDLGTQVSPFTHDDGRPVINRKVMVCFELYTDPKMDDGRPYMVSERYTQSWNEKSNLVNNLLEPLVGKEYEEARSADLSGDALAALFKSLLGRVCLVSVKHKEKKAGGMRAVITGVMALPKAMKAAVEAQVNPSLLLDLDAPAATVKAVLDQLPQWVQEEVGKSPEYQHLIQRPAPDEDDSIPF